MERDRIEMSAATTGKPPSAATPAALAPLAGAGTAAGGRWQPLLRAMGQTGTASLAAGLLGMLATKIVAVVLGPAEVALLATLQQLRNTALTGATLNGQTALVRGLARGAAEPGAETAAEAGEALRTALVLMTAATAVVAAAVVLGRERIALWAGLDRAQAPLVALLAAAVVLAAGFVVLASMLNALGAIGALALVQLAAPAALAALAYPAAVGFGKGRASWWPALLAASAAASVLAAGAALHLHRRRITSWLRAPGGWFSRRAAGRFFVISGSLLVTGWVSQLALVAVRARILRSEGLAAGGQFDAAWAISMNQTSLVLASLQTYYLPLLARTPEAAGRAAHTSRVLTIAALAAAVLIAALAALKPTVIALLYSEAFRGAALALRWTLIGDYLKISSWVLSVPLVAAADLRGFLAAELAAYGVFAAAAVALSPVAGAAQAAAMAFLAMYAVHLALCGLRLFQRGEFAPGRRTTAAWCAGLALVAGVSALNWNLV